ncbi:MAG: hypothetical protein K6A65_02655 [Succinivibrionaceae bacterium]|nr:hypothetical protein [Succinivibrionaceae bacterium]
MRITALLLALAAPLCALGASFDCTQAQSYDERAICALPELSYADDTLAAELADLRARYPGARDLESMAAALYQARAQCQSETCIKAWYTDARYRLHDFDAYRQALGSVDPSALPAAQAQPPQPQQQPQAQLPQSQQPVPAAAAPQQVPVGGVLAVTAPPALPPGVGTDTQNHVLSAHDACRAGDASSCEELYEIFMSGRYVPQDPAHGAAYGDRACKQGSARACRLMGMSFYLGYATHGFTQDPRQALRYFTIGCQERREPTSCHLVGYMFFTGQVVGMNAARAIEKHQEACHHSGDGLCEPRQQALRCSQGDANACSKYHQVVGNLIKAAQRELEF